MQQITFGQQYFKR